MGGKPGAPPSRLSTGSQDEYEVQLVTDGTTTTAVWVRLDGGFFHAPPNSPLYGGTYRTQASSSTNGGITWSSPSTIASFTQPATETTANPPTRELQLVTDGATITAAWQRFDGSNTRIQVASYTPTTRIAGPDRFSTSAAVAQEFDTAATVYIANGRNYPDALSAAPAAAHANGPLLLTEQGSLPAVIAAEIVRLDPGRIVVVGGTGVVSLAVESALEALQPGTQVERIAGADRYETSREVTADAFQSGAPTAFIATGSNFPDALAASAAASHYDGPVILTNGSATEIDTATLDLLDTLNTTEVLLAGGTGVVSTGIESSLKAVFGDPNVRRLAGANRYATSIAINTDTFTASPTVYLAVGTGYADALSGAALAGKNDAPLFVVPGTCVPQGVLDAIVDLGATKVVLLGGSGVLNSSVANLVKCA